MIVASNIARSSVLKDTSAAASKMVLVTGATGFIGRRLCAALKEHGARQVRALGRQESDGPWDEFVAMDLTGELPSNALDGVDTVFHLAGKAHALSETRQDEDEYFQINTFATQRLLEFCRTVGVKTFVYFSSVKAVGDIDGLMDESISVKPDTPYGRSKRASERLVMEGGYVPHPIVIRPSMVYGNTEKGNMPKMIRAVEAGRFPPLPEFNNKRSMVHVDDVVRAVLLAAESEVAAGQVYIVTDGEAYSTRQIYAWICEALNKSVPVWHVPVFVLKLLAKAGDLIGFIRGRRFTFDSDALKKLTGSACYSSVKIERELGFRAKRKLREALPEIIRSLQ